MSGGAYEGTSAYNKNGSDVTYGGITNGLPFADGTSDKYSTAYDVNSTSYASEISEKSYKYGDATYETIKWHSDELQYITIDLPFFYRGGACTNSGGIFSSWVVGGLGAGHGYGGFRVCLIV
mgnify:CR=1 FL=1